MKRFFVVISVSAFCLALWSCGNGPGAPGSSGSEDTGIEVQSVSIVPDSTATDIGPDLDANVHICSNGQPEKGLFRVDATMTITAAKLNPTSNFDPFPASVQQCTITYKQPADEFGAPVIEAWTVYPDCTLVDGSNTCIVNLIDITRKSNQYWDNICAEVDSSGYCISGGINDPQKYPTRYVASYYCTYMNNFGKSGHFSVDLEIFLADFETCT
jgi:hypothetical protein